MGKRGSPRSVDDIVKSIEEPKQDVEPPMTKRVWQSGVIKVLVVIGMLGVLLLLKSGEETYHSMVSSAHATDFDPYERLNIKRSATKAEIKKAHRALSLQWHPDKREEGCDEDCRKTFKQINEAYKLLMDDGHRRLYDQTQKVSSGSSQAFFTQLHPAEYLFTTEAWKRLVQPSLEYKQLWTPAEVSGTWAFLIADPRSQLTEHLLPLWTELAQRFYGRVSIMRIDATDPQAMKMLPVKLAITPAIMMISSGGVPALYDRMHSFQPRHLVTWMNENIPSPFVKKPADYDVLQKGSGAKLPAVFVSPDRNPPKLLDAVANRFDSVFDWAQSPNVDFFQSLPKLKRSTKGVLVFPEPFQFIEIPNAWWKLDKIDLRTVSQDDNPSAEAHAELLAELTKIIRLNEVPVYEESLPFLCPSNIEDQVVCNIRIDATAPLENAAARRALIADVIKAKVENDTEEEDVVEVDEFEADDLEDDVQSQKPKEVQVQLLRLHTKSLSAYGSALIDHLKAKAGVHSLIFDARAGVYQPDQVSDWLALPDACNSAVGRLVKRSFLTNVFGSGKPFCLPRLKLDTRKTVWFWFATHRMISVCVVAALGAIVILLPKRLTKKTGVREDVKED